MTTARLLGRSVTPGDAVRRWKAGTASSTRKPVATTTVTTGRASAGRMIAAHTRLSPRVRRLPRNGMRPRSTRSPSSAISAGRTVSEPSMETITTIAVASAMPMKVPRPVRNMAAIATTTVNPEVSTALPEVAAAVASASRFELPAARSSRARRKMNRE